jgi:hypothetical protein
MNSSGDSEKSEEVFCHHIESNIAFRKDWNAMEEYDEVA